MLQGGLSLLATIWRLPERHENSRLLIKLLSGGQLSVMESVRLVLLPLYTFVESGFNSSAYICLYSWLDILSFSFSVASAIFQTGSSVSGLNSIIRNN